MYSDRKDAMLEQPSQEHSQRFWAILLILLAVLGFTYFYVLPFLSSHTGSDGWSETQRRQIAFDLAQNVQRYRHQLNERRRINYGDASLEATGVATPFRPPNPFDGMDSPSGAKNDTHSEAKLKGWALATIRRSLQTLPSGSIINVLIFTQVKTCPECRKAVPT